MRALGVIGLVAALFGGLSFLSGGMAEPRTSAKNVILFIGDGFGAAQTALGLNYAREVQGRGLHIEGLMGEGNTGYALPVSHGAVVTDSAAASTQIASGTLVRNEMVGLDADGRPVETVLEWAERGGLATGLVSNMRLTHATPAALAAHQISRYQDEQEFADDIFSEHEIEVLLGGGARAMVPQGQRVSRSLPGLGPEVDGASRRKDDRNLIELMRQAGYAIASDRASLLRAASSAKRIVGLFAASHLPYVVDRRSEGLDSVPSLPDMTQAALDVLARHPRGFFLMVEGGRIDYAGHDNDAGTMLHEVLQFDQAIGVGMRFQAQRPETLIIVTADHGTGGFSFSYRAPETRPVLTLSSGLRYQRRWAYPGKAQLELLGRQTVSFDRIVERAGTDPEKLVEEVQRATGLELTWEEAVRATSRNSDGIGEVCDFKEFYPEEDERPKPLLGRALARQTFVVWSTGGHTTDPVLTYGRGPGAEALRGVYVNAHLHSVMKNSLQ